MDKRLQIVLAEDNEADAFVVRMALEETGLTFHLQVCQDGEAALRYLDEIAEGTAHSPDIFLLDLNLPKISGDRVLMALRSLEHYRSTPVVMITSSENPADRQRCSALGLTNYFIKPPDLNEFMKLGTLVRDALKSNSA